VWQRRWKWVQDCDEWPAFVAWCDTRPWAHRVQLQAALGTLLDSGPMHDSYQVGEDLYAEYAPCNRTVLWIIVGVAQPGKRLLLPLVWGTSPTGERIAAATAEATAKLQKWRGRI
jgi:hypothetical protein